MLYIVRELIINQVLTALQVLPGQPSTLLKKKFFLFFLYVPIKPLQTPNVMIEY